MQILRLQIKAQRGYKRRHGKTHPGYERCASYVLEINAIGQEAYPVMQTDPARAGYTNKFPQHKAGYDSQSNRVMKAFSK